MGRQLLFVTYLTSGFEAGFSYCSDLARLMDKDIDVLVIEMSNTLMDKVDDLWGAVTFAEAGEHDTAREISTNHKIDFRERINFIKERCRELGINFSVHHSRSNVVSAIKEYMSQKNGIDLILLDLTITENEDVTARELKRLVRTASRPIVTIGKEACAI